MIIGVDVRVLQEKELTGVGSYTLKALKSILEIDKENQYILYSSGLKRFAEHISSLQRPNVQFFHLPIANKILNLLHISGLNHDFFQKFPVRPDVFWLPNINFYRFQNVVPTVLTIHDLSFMHRQRFFSGKHVIWHNLVNIKKMISDSTAILTVSENTKRDVVRLFSKNLESIYTVYPGVDIDIFDTDDDVELASRFGIDRRFFLYVGTVEPRKNILALIQAFQQISTVNPEIDLVIAGKLGWSYAKLVEGIKGNSRIKYLGYVSQEEKSALYKQCLALVWPSFYEGFGFPPLEATKHRCPVITSHMSSLPEIMKQQAIYVDPYNSSDIAAAMGFILNDTHLTHSLRESASAMNMPTWDDFAKKVLKIFQTVYENHSH